MWESIFTLFGGLQQRRLAGAELLQQGRLVGLGGSKVAGLDRAEAADFLRDRSEADSKRMIVGRQLGEDFLERCPVIRDQLTLGPALLRIAEDVERRAAEEFEAGEHLECAHHPRAEAD